MIGSGQFIVKWFYKKAVMPKYDGKKLTQPQQNLEVVKFDWFPTSDQLDGITAI